MTEPISPSTFPSPASTLELGQIANNRMRNRELSINKLPLELLSRIFVAGSEELRIKNESYFPYPPFMGFQDIVVQVCSHWRSVAIGDPTLWRYIRIFSAPPHELASVYLARCGPTVSLDIDLEWRSRYTGKLEIRFRDVHITTQVIRTLDLLVSYGARINRWRSLRVCAKTAELLYLVIGIMHAQSAPALQFLSLQCKKRLTPLTLDDETISTSYQWLLKGSHFISSVQLPQLHSVELDRLPAHYLFDQSQLQLTGLTHLKVISAHNLISLPKLHVLLSSSLQLQSLSLGTGFPKDDDFEQTDLCVHLPSLRYMSLTSVTSWAWGLGVLKMVDAPAVQSLHISSSYGMLRDGAFMPAIEYIATGQLRDGNTIVHTQFSAPKPIYPILRHLDVHDLLDLHISNTKVLRELFTALNTVIYLVTSEDGLEALGSAPWVMPNLVYIQIVGYLPEGLGDILRRRTEAGFPMEAIEAEKAELERIRDCLPESISLVEHPFPVHDPNYDSDAEEIEERDEERDEGWDGDEGKESDEPVDNEE